MGWEDYGRPLETCWDDRYGYVHYLSRGGAVRGIHGVKTLNAPLHVGVVNSKPVMSPVLIHCVSPWLGHDTR